MKIPFIEKILPKAIFVIWLLFVISYLCKVNYFSLSIEKLLPPVSLGLYRGDPLMRGDVVVVDCHSQYQKLGAIGVRFNTFYEINNDILRFRIKEAGQGGWYYEHDYKVEQFQQNKIFSFEFPVINDSVGKIYQVEIESLNGISGDAVAIASPLTNSVFARHIFTQKELLADRKTLSYFIYHKLVSLISDPQFQVNLSAYSLLLLFYVIYVLMGSSMGAFSVIIFLSVLLDILFIKEYSAFFGIPVLSCWWLLVWRNKIGSRVSSSVFMAIFFLSLILYLTGLTELAGKAAVWAYLFLAFSVAQSVYEIKTRRKNLTLVKDYWRQLVVEGQNMGRFLYLIIIGEINVTIERVKMGRKKATMLTLVIYRWESPMVKTYIYTSWFAAYLIVCSVRVLGFAVRFGPYAVFGGLVYITTAQIRGYLNFFQEFFMQNQISLFWHQIGKSIGAMYLIVLVVFVLSLYRWSLNLRKKVLVGIVVLYFCSIITRVIYETATPYRNDLKVWTVSPSETAEPWVDVTITGRNLGEMPFVGKVYIDGVEQRIIKWEKNEIVFRTNPLITKSGYLAVRGYNKMVSDTIRFTYTGNR